MGSCMEGLSGVLFCRYECLGRSCIAKLLFKQKKLYCSRGMHKLWCFWQEWKHLVLRWSPWELHILQFRGTNSLLHVLAWCAVILSHLEHTAMAAEAPDHHSGDLGSLEEARKGQNGTHPVGHRKRY